MQPREVIVVGRGLAGTLLSWFLVRAGIPVILYSDELPAASHAAAGIIHPVTGRRLVKSWMADTLIPFAAETYRQCEQDTEDTFYSERTILELLRGEEEYNRWMSASDATLSGYTSAPFAFQNDSVQPFPHAVEVQGSCLDVQRFLAAMLDWLEARCTVIREPLTEDPQADPLRPVVYCEGFRGMSNPLWEHLPWQLSKGEMLTIRCPRLNVPYILNRKVFLLPLGGHHYRAGSTYAWETLNDLPTEEARDQLVAEIEKIIRVPFEVTGQVAAIRPTVKERRPFLGFHPLHPGYAIFNGLGTKGAMSAPWLAHHLTQHLLGHGELLAEINVQRYAGMFQSHAS